WHILNSLPVRESGRSNPGARECSPGETGTWRRKAREESLGMNGTYLSEFATQPGGPEGRPHTTAGSKPIRETGRPRGVRPCSPLLGWRSSHLVPSPVSNSRTHGGGPAQAREPLPAGGLLLNHARYNASGELAA